MSRSARRSVRTVTALAVGALALAAMTSCAPAAPAPAVTPTTATSSPAVLPSGQKGAAHFDEGYLQLGDGPKTVDLYVDPICPYCKKFESLSGPLLFSAVEQGEATLRLHPLAFLDRLSAGTAYSTRAASYLTAVAVEHPDHLQAFFQQLFDQQPAENTAGLSDAQLDDLARAAGIPSPEDLDPNAYAGWIAQRTQLAAQGPLPTTTQIPRISHVPVVMVDGDVFGGNSGDTADFAAFYASR
ncbi:thioredoxin domain-containing protein [uncultured Microbacterium sp.]|uniref:DsbA family protein n=1 Tax=uncultured Microbacterium sp. TaxID=191216 RepID=UPI0025F432AE|nr:thioredoxin domain-containing protein [uncultured Microbacterium sp.]